MPKIGDGYFQFSERGLKQLLDSIKLVGGSAKRLENIGRSQGLFENSLSKDLAAVRLLTAEIRTATKQAKSSRDAVRQLRAESARSSLNTDRLVEQRRATANSRANIARNDTRNVASSPAAMAAERAALESRRKSLTSTKSTIKSEALIDPTTTAAFKNAVDQTFQSLKGLPATKDTADKIRDAAKALGRFRAGNVRQVVNEMNDLADATEKAAKAADRLSRLENLSRSLSPEKKQQIRGSIRDEQNAPKRVAAIAGRQSQREIDSEPGGQRAKRRLSEINAVEGLTGSQIDAEVSIAAREIVESLERVAKGAREAAIDGATRAAANQYSQGRMSDDTFRANVTRSEARKSGASDAGAMIDDAHFRTVSRGMGTESVKLKETLDQLVSKQRELAAAGYGLTGAAKAQNDQAIKSLGSDIKLTRSKLKLSQDTDALTDSNKELLAAQMRLASAQDSGRKESVESRTDRLSKAAAELESINALPPGSDQEIAGRRRGAVNDSLLADQRDADISKRQAQREIDSEPGGQRIGRRIDEIDARKDLTGSQRAAEVSIASDEVAESLERLAQRVREVPIDTELQNVAEKFRRGTASEGEFRAAVTASKAKKSGAEQAANVAGEAEFRARNEGDSESTVELSAKLLELTKIKDDLIKKNSTLSASEQEVNEAVIASINSDIKSVASKRDISRALDAEIDITKALLAEKSRLDVAEAKGGKLVGDDLKARKKNNEELDAAAKRQNKLKSALKDSNASLHDAAGASRNLNFKYQQLSYGVQDFVQVIGQTGLSGALRASANNMAAFFGASGTGAGAIWGAVGTVAMIGLADAIAATGDEAETTSQKMDKLADSVDRISEARKRLAEFAGGLAEKTSSSELNVSAIASSSSSLIDNQLATRERQDAARLNAKQLAKEAQGGTERGGILGAASNQLRLEADTLRSMFTNIFGFFDKKSLVLEKLGMDSTRKIAMGEAGGESPKAAQQRAKESLDKEMRGLMANTFLESSRDALRREYDLLLQNVVMADESTADGMASILAALGADNEAISGYTADISRFETDRQRIMREASDSLDASLGQVRKFLEDSLEKIDDGDASSGASAAKAASTAAKEAMARREKLREQASNMALSEQDREDATQLIANEDTLIAALMEAFDKIKIATEKATGKEESASVTAIEGLHRKIQDSLSGTVETELDKEKIDLLKQIERNTAQAANAEIPSPPLPVEKAPSQKTTTPSPAQDEGGRRWGWSGAVGQFSVPPPQFNYSRSASEGAQKLESDPTLKGAREILNDAIVKSIDLMSARAEREQSSLNGLRTSTQRGISGRNIESLGGRRGPASASVEESMANARRNVQMQGLPVNRFGGAVADFAPGLRGSALTESQRRAISSPASVPANESPEEQRKRRIAERRAEFGAMPDAGPQLNARTVKTAIAAMKPVFEAGPAFTREDADKFRKEKESAGIAGREAAAQAAIDRREAVGPVFENTHEAQTGPRRAMEAEERKARGEAARAAREEKIRAAAEARAAEMERRAGIKSAAEEDLQSRMQIDPETGESLPTKKSNKWSRSRRDRLGLGPSWMQQHEANASTPLSSNVQTDTAQQTQTAQTEATEYQKRTADTLVEMLKLMRTRGPSEGLLIG